MAEQDLEFAKRFLSANEQITPEVLDKLKQVDEAELAKIINEAVGSEVSKLQTFMDLAKNLRMKQDELDIMAADTLPSAILTSYMSEILEPNNNGDLVSIVAKSPGEQEVLNGIYESLALPLPKIAYSLLKNAIAIGEFERQKVTKQDEKAANESIEAARKSGKKGAVEEVKVKINYGRLLPEMTIIQDTTRVFPILKNEKCIGFIEVTKPERLDDFDWQNDILDYEDVVIHSKSDYTYVKFGVSKSSKPLQLRIKGKDQQGIQTYDIDIGCSLLENSYSAWKTLSILLDSIVLASLIKNATTIIIQTESGNMTEAQIEAAKVKLKGLFEGKLALGQNGLKSYISPQAKPNYVYSFTQGEVGKITSETIGGQYDPGQLYYITPYVNAFFAGMNDIKQNYGFTEGAGGLDGGGAVEQYSKQHSSTVSEFKRLIADFIKNAINHVLLSRGLHNLVNNFEVVIYKAYKEEDQSVIQMQQQQMQIMGELLQFLEIEDPKKVRDLKLTMVKKVFSDKTLIEAIEEAMVEEDTPDTETTSEPESEEIQEEEDLLDSLGENVSIGGEGGSGDVEAPIEEEEPVEGEEGEDLPDLPPMLGSIPEGEE